MVRGDADSAGECHFTGKIRVKPRSKTPRSPKIENGFAQFLEQSRDAMLYLRLNLTGEAVRLIVQAMGALEMCDENEDEEFIGEMEKALGRICLEAARKKDSRNLREMAEAVEREKLWENTNGHSGDWIIQRIAEVRWMLSIKLNEVALRQGNTLGTHELRSPTFCEVIRRCEKDIPDFWNGHCYSEKQLRDKSKEAGLTFGRAKPGPKSG